MLSSVQRTIAAHRLCEPGDRLLAAVSGGPDSMALVHALWELRDRLGITLEVATVDHGLRPEARREAELVRERAAALELPFHLLRVTVARGGGSLQDAARRARLGALEELASRRGARRVALGHQVDDQAETVLFRIVRGTGLAGLAGIPYQRGPFIRPLLDVRRAEVLRYLRRRSIPFVEDPSNADLRFARARIRHRILPALAAENPRVAEALVALAAAARAGSQAGDTAPAGLNRRAAEVIERLRAAGAGSTRVDLAGGRVAEIAYGSVRLRPAGGGAVTAELRPSISITGPGAYELPGSPALVVEVGGREPESEAAVAFDADRIAWPLTLRARRPGDRMRPRGGRGSRKVADLLIDAKIPRPERARLPLLATADDIVLYVPGLRPGELGRPSAATTRFLHVSLGGRADDLHL
jgi:tRNA(Ile)-lysidine synthase